ncbi:MAG: hypothetical protein ACYSWQ_09000 [Planctomycetota bacterium]|jgi:hypothetical protein
MKRFVIGLVILGVIAAQSIADLPKPPPGATAFDLTYRGLSGEKDELSYNSFWGFGQSGGSDTAFITEVRKKAEKIETVNNWYLAGAEWAAVETRDDRPVAFYFDLNADGKVSDDEVIQPAQTQSSGSSRRTTFVTPNFTMKTREGNQVPFRVLLQAAYYGSSSHLQCMWSPSCILEGTSSIAGKSVKLILYTSGFMGSFTEYGRCSYSLLAGDVQPGRYVPRQSLSSLVNYEGKYYRLKLQGKHEKGKNVRAVLEEYTGATGKLAVKLTGNSDLTARLSSASLAGSEDKNIRLRISGDQSVLPAEAYKLTGGNVDYGVKTNNQCRVGITEGPDFRIEAEKTCNVELGKPVLAVRAIDEKKRYSRNAKAESVFAAGTAIHFSPKIKGKAGELYGRFSQRNGNSRSYKDVEPTIRIVDSNGKEVASATMKYG